MSLPLAAFSDGFFIFGSMLAVLIVGVVIAFRLAGSKMDALKQDADTPDRRTGPRGRVEDEGESVRMS